MPLKKGSSKKTVSSNIKELNNGPVGPTRDKAIKTLAKRLGISYDEAKKRLSIAIAESKAHPKN